MATINYQGADGANHADNGVDVQHDGEMNHWVLDQFVDRGGFTRYVRVPVQRVYSVRIDNSDLQPPSSTEGFIDGTLSYQGPEGEETLRVGGLSRNTDDVLWYDAGTDHWVAWETADDTTGATVHYVPTHRVYSVAERVDLDRREG